MWFKDIKVLGDKSPKSIFTGYDSEHMVENIFFKNIRFGNKVVTDIYSEQCEIGKFVKNVSIER